MENERGESREEEWRTLTYHLCVDAGLGENGKKERKCVRAVSVRCEYNSIFIYYKNK
jgi:hypothetical protein